MTRILQIVDAGNVTAWIGKRPGAITPHTVALWALVADDESRRIEPMILFHGELTLASNLGKRTLILLPGGEQPPDDW